MNENEALAFVAGVIEGEGGFYLAKGPKKYKNKVYYHYRPMIEFINTDLELLRFCQSVIGGTIYDKKDKAKNLKFPLWKKCYFLSIYGIQNCLKTVDSLRPFLVTDKSRGDLLAEYCTIRLTKGREPYGQREHEIYSLMKRGKAQ